MFSNRLKRLACIVLLIGFGCYTVVLPQDLDTDHVLTAESTLDEIVIALETAHENYETLHVVLVSTDHLNNIVTTDEAWLSQTESAYRWESGFITASGDMFETLNICDGEYMYHSNGLGGQPLVTLAMLDPSYDVAKALGPVTTSIAPGATAEQLADPTAEVEIAGLEMINGREALKVIYASDWRMRMMTLWIDTETGILLKFELLTPDGELVRTDMVDSVEFDPIFENAESLFDVDGAAYDPDQIARIFHYLQTPIKEISQ